MGKPISGLKKRVDWFYTSPAWREARSFILQRDHYTCVLCGFIGNSESLQVDHILARKSNPELSLHPLNLRTLCRSCHARAETSFSRGPGYKAKKRTNVGADGFPSDDWR